MFRPLGSRAKRRAGGWGYSVKEWVKDIIHQGASAGEHIDLSLVCSWKINLLALIVFLLLLFSSSLSVPRLVEWVLENINRMQSCLIINPFLSAPWPPALDHVRSPPALVTPSPAQILPFSSEEEAKSFCVCAAVWCVCAHVHRESAVSNMLFPNAGVWNVVVGWFCNC